MQLYRLVRGLPGAGIAAGRASMRFSDAAWLLHHQSMRFAGKGSDVWHVRVDLIAPDDSGSRVTPAAEELRRLLNEDDTPAAGGGGADQGIGIEGQPVVGLTFWVRADDVGAAAMTALDTARLAGRAADVGADYYAVSLVPRSAILMPEDEHTVRRTD
jgi:hypothetical protein